MAFIKRIVCEGHRDLFIANRGGSLPGFGRDAVVRFRSRIVFFVCASYRPPRHFVCGTVVACRSRAPLIVSPRGNRTRHQPNHVSTISDNDHRRVILLLTRRIPPLLPGSLPTCTIFSIARDLRPIRFCLQISRSTMEVSWVAAADVPKFPIR